MLIDPPSPHTPTPVNRHMIKYKYIPIRYWANMFAPPAGLFLFFSFFLIYFVLVIFMYILYFNQQSLRREINEPALTLTKEHQNV